MFTKHILALFLWCHFYQTFLNPLLQLVLLFGFDGRPVSLLKQNSLPLRPHQANYRLNGQKQIYSNIYQPSFYGLTLVSASPITVEANKVALTPGREIVLRCNVTEFPDIKFAWFRKRVYPKNKLPIQDPVEEELKGQNAEGLNYPHQGARSHGLTSGYEHSHHNEQEPHYNQNSLSESSGSGSISSGSSSSSSGGSGSSSRSSDSNSKIIIGNNVIVLKSPTYEDVGNYFCRVKDARGDVEKEKLILVRAQPNIREFQIESSTLLSVAVEEGKSLKIPCDVDEYFEPESNLIFNWLVSKYDDESDSNHVVSGEDGISIEVYNSTSQALLIDKITKDHRKFYKCQVSNGIAESSKTIFLRVRDKNTVIWPTVGIVLELLVLVGVICVVENRKVEPDRDNYDRKAIQM